jgi:hypothetical protein
MSTVLHKTRDYGMFESYSGNRNINPEKVRALLRSFNERHYPVPIIVDQQMRVLDGQHRLEAARAGGFPVFFLKLPEDIVPTQVIRQLNADQKPYSLPDHLKLYVEDGREQYLQFRRLYDKYDEMLGKLNIPRRGGPKRIIFGSMLALLCGRDGVEGSALLRHAPKPWDRGSPTLATMFRSGDMELNPAKGVATLDYLIELLGAFPRQRVGGEWSRRAYAHFKTREYLCSLHYLLHYRNEHVESQNEAFDPQVFLGQARLYPKKCLCLEGQPKKWTEALAQIEGVYNHERGKRRYTYLVSA